MNSQFTHSGFQNLKVNPEIILTFLARFWLQAFVAAACGGMNAPLSHVLHI